MVVSACLKMGEMCQSLIEWFQTLNLTAAHSTKEELSDGVALAQALNQFAPESFTDIWLLKIKTDVRSNWRLKLSNLKKVIEGIYDYYCDVLNYSLSEFPRPDPMRIAESCDSVETGRLLQLILGCAVNCSSKQDYIRKIMSLEESLQANIMRALQELESSWQGSSITRNSLSIVNFDFKTLLEDRDQLAQKCYEMEQKIALLSDERSILKSENKKLEDDIKRIQTTSIIDDDGASMGPVKSGSVRYNDMRRQLDNLKEELIQSETCREDLRLKSQQQESELQILQQRVEELNKIAAEFIQLKDEIDILRESNENLKSCEAQVITFKKKMEDYNDLKKQVKLLEERSHEYLQQNVHFEDNVKKCAALKGQVELYKKEIQELHIKLDKEMENNIKLEFEHKNMKSTITALIRSRDNLLKERDSLREAIDELKCGQVSKHFEVNQLQETLSQNADLQNKITHLESTLTSREQELVLYDTKYRKCLERTKDIIKNMDTRILNVDVNTIENIQEPGEYSKAKLVILEENLILTAFYRLCLSTQRESIDSKMAILMGQGHTFLSRQRQGGPRKISPAIKGK